MELTLLRHAPPHREYHGCYNGHTDIPIDTALFDPGKIESLLHHQFDRIYSSDLKRCTSTLTMMGITVFTTDIRLREVCFKPSIEGKNFAQIEAADDFNPHCLDSQESWHDYICEESRDTFSSRIESFLKELPRDKTILICAHAGTIQKILSLLASVTISKPLNYLEYTKVRIK